MNWIIIYIIISLIFGWCNEYYYPENIVHNHKNWLMISILYILICWFVIPIFIIVKLNKWWHNG